MPSCRVFLRFVVAAAFGSIASSALAQTTGTALVRHAPSVNGTIDGSVQQMLPESVTLNGGAVVTGDLLVAGTPTVRLNGKPNYGGTLDGSGAASPTNYQVTLNGNTRLGHVVRRTNAVAIPAVAAPPQPAGTRTVTINSAGQSAGNFATLRHLTLNGNVGQFAIPPGTYGDFTANGGSGFTLGVAGATQPAVYNFQRLTLNGQTQVQILGPVVITVANGFAANGTLGSSAHPSRLTLNVYSGGFTLNGGCNVYGYVNAPNGTVIINGNSQLIGGVTSDRLTINGGGLLRLQIPQATNQPPVANNLSFTLPEDGSAAVTLAATDADGQPLTYAIGASPAHGVLTGTAPNLTYTPAANFSGPDSFTFKANDGQADSNTATVTLNVTPVPDAPLADAKELQVNEDAQATVVLSGSDADADGLSFNVVADPAHGTLSGSGGSRTYTPAANYSGPDSFTYVAFDGSLTSAPATVAITVQPQPDRPVALPSAYSVNEGASVAITLTGTDADGDALSFARLSTPANGTLTGTAPHFTYTPNLNFDGTDSFTFTASDAALTSDPATITIRVVDGNYPPQPAPVAVQTDEDTPKTITLSAADGDNDPVSFTIVSGPSKGTLGALTAGPNNTATVLYTPNLNVHGSDSFTFKANDGKADVLATASITIAAVNDAPIAEAQSVGTDEDTPVTIVLSASDAENTPLTFTIVTPPAQGTLGAVIGSGNTANVTYTPATNANGISSFTFKANDGEKDSEPVTVTINVRAINDAPVAANDSATTPEDTTRLLTLTASDVDSANLSFTIATPPTQGTLGPITPTSSTTATVTYTPAENVHGNDSFTFVAHDGETPSASSPPATITLTITPVNDAPVAADQSVTFPETEGGTLTLAATDADGDPLTYSYTQPQHGTLSGTAPNLTYTPVANYVGPDSFTFTASDPVPLASDPATVSITVFDVNTPPTAADQSFALDEDTSHPFTPDVTDADNDALTYTITVLPQHGSLADVPPGPVTARPAITYTPASNYAGPDSFTYEVRDGSATPAQATVTFTVRPINDAPVASSGSVETTEDTPAAVTLVASDVEDTALTYTITTAPTHGTLTPNGGASFTYTPAANYHGSDSFVFRATDSAGVDSNLATISLAVTPVNDAPVAAHQTVETDEDVAVTLTLSATDLDSAALTFALQTAPEHGTLGPLTQLSPTSARLTYRPAVNYNGADQITFKANDGQTDSALATITLTIRPINDAPVANPQTVFTSTGTPTSIVLTGSDVESAALTFTIVSQPQRGTLAGTAPNLTYTSAPDFGGFDSFTFVTNDGSTNSPPATVQVTSGLPPRSRTYTTTADFAAGSLVAVSTDVADQLSNKTVLAAFDVVWITNSQRGTLVKIDPETGRVVGEYLTKPDAGAAPYPSRVAVDSKGNAWVGNMTHGSIVKVGQPQNGYWVDRNSNGLIDTSSALGELLPWAGADAVSSATDEAILLYVQTTVGGVRHIAIDGDDNVWVTGNSGPWEKFDGRTGALLRTEPSIGRGENGGFLSADGKMYSSGNDFLIWNTSNSTESLPEDDIIRQGTWASALDSQGNLWTTRDWTSTVMKYSPTGQLLGEFYHGEPWAMGIAIDANDHVWIAHSHCGHSVGHLLPDGTFIGNVEVANHGPVEVSIDRRGRIWVVSSTGVVERINPLGGPLGTDGQTPVGEVDIRSGNLGGALWTYGRFTGSSFGLSTPDGFWTNIYDGVLAASTWGAVVWSGDVCNDARIEVEAALSANGTTFGPFQPLSLANPTPTGAGRYLKTRVRLVSASSGEAPILHDLTVGTTGYTPPTTAPSWHAEAGDDIKGNWPDIIQLKGAFCHSIHVFPAEADSYAWSKVSGPGAVTFTDASNRRTTAQFSTQGTYVLRLTATLNGVVSTDEVSVALTPYNRAPYPNAGYTTFRADVPPQLWLWGSVRDDGLPLGNAVTSTWSKLFGPGAVTFADPSAPTTTASFSTPGVYVLSLKATDGELTGEDVTTVWLGFSCIPTAPDGIVSWWQASANGDDHIGGNQAFTERGADYAEGRIGGAFRFDGINDRIRVFGAPSLNVGTGGGFTMELWVRPSSSRVATMVEYGENTTHGFSLRQIGNQIEANFREANGTSHVLTTGGLLATSVWTHVAATYDRTTGEARIFVNGSPAATQNIGTFALATTLDVFMGAASHNADFYHGLLDEVSVYNRALYADELNTIVTSPAGKRPPVSNVPPIVNAGPNLGGKVANSPVAIGGTVTDDGQPTNGSLFTQWSKVAGPGNVAFSNPNNPSTTASFSEGGIYMLKLFADDGGFCSEDTVEVRVGALHTFEPDSSLVAWWTGNGTDLDAVRRLKLERFNGTAFSEGLILEGFRFNGVSTFARTTAVSAIDVGASATGFSVEFWFRRESIVDGPVFRWTNGSGIDRVQAYFTNGGNDLRWHIPMVGDNGAGHSFTTNIGQITANQWHHAALTFDAASRIGRIYLDGRLASAETAFSSGVPDTRPSGYLYVGGAASDLRFKGIVDEFSLFNRPLTSPEISTLYRSNLVGKSPLDGNAPPVIALAQPHLSVPNASGAAVLLGSVIDDALPANRIVTQIWTKLDGPGVVTFADPQSANTTATFGAPGTYVLSLDAHDGFDQPAGKRVEVRVGVTAAEPPAGLAAWWPGNNHPREIVRGGHDLELLNGTGYGVGQVSQGFLYPAAGSFARVPAHADFDIGASATGFTIEFWVKRDSITDGPVVRWTNASGIDRVQAYFTNGGNDLRWHIPMVGDNGAGHSFTTNVGQIATNQWHHFALTFDAATRIGRIYRNGRLASAETAFTTGQPDTRGTGYLYIGGAIGDTRFKGTMDEVTLYSRPLSVEEVNGVFGAGIDGKTPPDDNLPPVVNAGPNLPLPDVAAVAQLNGSVTDDNKPFGPALSTWSLVSGPGTVTFANANSAATSATFSAPGTYLLKLTGTDQLTTPVSDLTEVRVGSSAMEPPSGIAAWWPGNGDPRELIHGNHDLELFNGAGYGPAQVSHGFLYNGTSSFSRVVAHADFDVGLSPLGFSVEFWVKRDSIVDGPVFRWKDGGGNDRVQAYFTNGGNDLRWHIPMVGDSGAGHSFTTTIGQIVVGSWHHFVLTFDGASRIGRIFHNGRLASAEVGFSSGRPDTRPLGYLYLGGALDDTRFKGTLDEFTLYDRPLAVEEIALLAQAGAHGKAPPDDNLPPVANAGPDVALGSVTASALLSGSVSDDGRPFGEPQVTWSLVDGPGTATFGDANAATTTATFSVPGTYLLKFTATDQLAPAVFDFAEVRVVTAVVEPPSGIAAWWPGNGHAREVIRGNHDLQLMNGTTYAPGRVSQGFAHNGASSFARVPAHADFDVGSSAAGFTVEFWVKRDSIVDGPIFRWLNSSGQDRVQAYFTNGGNDLRWHIPMVGDGGSGHSFTTNVGTIGTAVWHHFALTFDRTTSLGRIYHNGRLASSEVGFGVGQPDTRPSGYLYVGGAINDTRFRGVVDEFTLYARPLSSTEVGSLAQAGAHGKAPPDDNLPPSVDAGPDVALSSTAATAVLSGTVGDDGKPLGAAVVTWSQADGPGTATFSQSTSPITSATFDAPGTYVLKLTASDQLNAPVSDLVEVRVDPKAAEPVLGIAASWPGNDHVREIVRGGHDLELLNGAGFGAGRVSRGFSYVSSSFSRVPAHADFDVGASSTGFTIEFWAKRDSVVDGPVLRWINGSGFERVQAYFTNGGNDLRWHIPMVGDNGAGHSFTTNVGQITPNVWHHFALIFEADTRIGRILVDGRLACVETSFGAGQPDTRGTGYLYIGGALNDTRFRGTIDEFTLYRRPLAIQEIAAIYRADVAGKTPPDENQPVATSAGPNVTIAGTSSAAALQGSVLDDNRPLGAPLAAWSLVSGPGTVTFADATAPATTATFSAAGTYLLRLTGGDGLIVPDSDVTEVRVEESPAALPAGLAAWWPLNGDTHDVVHPNHDVVLLNGAAIGVGHVLQGATFNGVSMARVAAHSDFDVGASPTGFTIEFWVKRDSVVDGPVLRWINSAGLDRVQAYFTNGGNDLRWHIPMVGDNGAGHSFATNVGQIAPNVWHHFALTFDATTRSAQIYRNGAVASPGTSFGAGTPDTRPSGYLYIGGAINDTRFRGTMDEFSLYDRALSAAEILAIAQAGAAGKMPYATNIAPVVVLASPPSGSAHVVDTPLTLSAFAADTDGTVSKVEFFDGATKLGEANAPAAADPTRFDLVLSSGLSVLGRHEIIARVTDGGGASSDSGFAVVNISPVLPDVQLTAPVANANLPAGIATTLAASATYSNGAIAKVEFFDGGAKLGEATAPSNGTTYSLNVASGFGSGAHVLTAKAIALDGSAAISSPVAITATIVLPTIALTAPAPSSTHFAGVALTLTSSASYAAGPIARVEFYDSAAKLGEATVPDQGAPSNYSFTAGSGLSLGIHSLSAKVIAVDGAVASSAVVSITVIEAPPEVAFVSPANNTNVIIGAPVTLKMRATHPTALITKVEFFEGATKLGERTTADAGDPTHYSLLVASGFGAGAHSLTAKATGSNATSATTAPLVINAVADSTPPTIAISSPTNAETVTAPTVIRGTISSATLNNWELRYRRKSAVCADWISFASGVNQVIDGDIGVFDTTVLPNGFYEVELAMTTTSGTSLKETRELLVDGSMKIGPFTTTFEDLTIPVAGLPLTVRRTYNNHERCPGDFGYGWNLDVSTVRLEKNAPLGSGWRYTVFPQDFDDQNPPTYSIDDEAPHVIGIIFPDGKTHRFRPLLKLLPDLSVPHRPFVPFRTANRFKLVFEPLTGTQGVLEVQGIPAELYLGDNAPSDAIDVDWYDRDVATDPFDAIQFLDATGYVFTALDGRKLTFDAAGKLTRMDDRAGNALTFTAGGVFHSTGAAITFTRDAQGRITKVTDPRGNDIRYEYSLAGDLIKVTDRVGNPVEYGYDGDHNLNSLKDPLGVEQLRNEYDAERRLRKTIDVFGFASELARNLVERTETITDALGNTRTIAYSARGDVLESTDALGNTTRYTYDANGNRTAMTNPLGHTVAASYDAKGLVSQIRTPGNLQFSLSYNSASQPTALTDSRGNAASLTYDAAGNVTSITDAYGNTAATTFNAAGQPLTYTDAAGAVSRKTYDALSRVLTETDQLGHTTHHTYDANGNRLTSSTTRILANGATQTLTTTYVYDGNDRLVETRDPLGQVSLSVYNSLGKVASTTDTLGRTTTYTYDAQGRPTGITYPDGTSESATFDVLGRRTSQTDRGGNTTSFSYDAVGRLIKTTRPDGSFTGTGYDAAGQVTSTTDARGNARSFAYDAVGRRTSTTDAQGQVTTYAYDQLGNLTSTKDAAGYTTQHEYDALNRRTATIAPDGSRTSYIYDPLGKVILQTDAGGHTAQWAYDAKGQLTVTTNAQGQATRYTYDDLGHVLTQTDAAGNVTRFTYDELGRRTAIEYPNGTTTSTGYDAAGRVIAHTDKAGRLTQFAYDAGDRLISVTDALGQTTSYTYDGLGNVLTQKDAAGRVTSYAYDVLGRRTKRTLPGGEMETFTYDESDNLIARKDFNGYTTTHVYDSLNRLIETIGDPSHPTIALGFPAKFKFTYNALGQRTRQEVLTAAGVLLHSENYTYDSRGRLVGKTTPYGTLTYGYDARDNLSSLSTTNGTRFSYVYDELSRLVAFTDLRIDPRADLSVNTSTTLYAYDSVGTLKQAFLPNGISTDFSYDVLGRLTRQLTRHNFGTVADDRYTFASSGERTRREEMASGRITDWSYDGLSRLTREVLTVGTADPAPGGQTDYVYDPVGNRLAKSSTVPGVPAQSSTYDTNDRLTSDVYDASGHTRTATRLINGAAVVTNDTYDFAGRLVQRTDSAGHVVDIFYDADGNRIGKRVDGVMVNYLVDAENPTGFPQVIEEVEIPAGGGAPIVGRFYGFGLSRISQSVSDGVNHVTSYYGQDAQGTVRFLTNTSGAVTDRYAYDAFGILIHRAGTTPNRYLYTGEQYDAELGMYYLRSRYYEPTSGRFWSMDSHEGTPEDPLSLHKYAYVQNNPPNLTDPSGQTPFIGTLMCQMALADYTAKLGALIGGTFGAINAAVEAALDTRSYTDGEVRTNIALGAAMGAGIGYVFGYVSVTNPTAAAVLAALFTTQAVAGAWEAFERGAHSLAAYRATVGVLLPIIGLRNARLYYERTIENIAPVIKSLRLQYLGRTPGKRSATGREVIERMRGEGKIMEDPIQGTMFQDSQGTWRPIAEADMAHKVDAVTWWNSVGRFFGRKAPEVRQWMLEPDNYYLEFYSINRSKGALLEETYLPPANE